MADLDPAVDVMLDAFDDDPVWLHLFADPEKRNRLLPKLYRTVVKKIIRDGELYGVGEPLHGIAWWVLPNAGKGPTLSKLEYAKLMFSPLLPYLGPVLEIYEELDVYQKRLVPGPHYYLKAIGISSRSRGKGLASKLIKPFLDQADDQKLPVYLETIAPSTLDVYKHYGFEAVKDSRLCDGLITVWCMLRNADGKRSAQPSLGNSARI